MLPTLLRARVFDQLTEVALQRDRAADVGALEVVALVASALAGGECIDDAAGPATVDLADDVGGTYQPRLTSPTMLEAGVRTSSKNVSLKLCCHAMLISGRTDRPGVRMSSTSRNEIPRCFGASGSVRVSAKIASA